MRPLSFKQLWHEINDRDRQLDSKSHKRKYKKKERQKAKKDIKNESAR